MTKTYGFDEFIKALGKLEKEFEDKSVSLLEETGDLAVAETQMRTPIDTGTLRRSITRSNVLDYEVKIGTSIEYARYVEEGHKSGYSGFVPGVFMLRDGVTIAEKRFKVQAAKMFEDITKEFRI